MSGTDLTAVSETIGIDLDALREKYKGVSDGSKPVSDEAKRLAAEEAFKVLEKYKTCTKCGGTGIVKSVYNFICMENNCDDCDGDGLLQYQVKNIIAGHEADANESDQSRPSSGDEEEKSKETDRTDNGTTDVID